MKQQLQSLEFVINLLSLTTKRSRYLRNRKWDIFVYVSCKTIKMCKYMIHQPLMCF